MATDWSSVAGLGLLFAFPDSMISVSIEQSCLHPEREGNAFCPTCGKIVKDRERRDFVQVYEARDALQDALPKGYMMRRLDSICPDSEIFIGYAMSTNQEDGPCAKTWPMPDIAEVERTIMALVEPYGVKVTKPFGLFLCQCVS